MGTLEARFRFDTRGMSLADDVESVSSNGGFRVRVSATASDNPTLNVEVQLEARTEQEGLVRAQAIVEAVYRRFLLDLSSYVAGATRPVRVGHAFTGPGSEGVATGRAAGTSVAIGVGVSVLDRSLVKPVLDCAVAGVEAGQLSTTAVLHAAQHMFRVAMETHDAVASYLICYSALALVAPFRRGASARGQGHVDRLLMAEDPTIVQRAIVRHDGRSVMESPFTEARNDFVHAEDRGQDPENAARAMSSRLAAFRDLTARILR